MLQGLLQGAHHPGLLLVEANAGIVWMFTLALGVDKQKKPERTIPPGLFCLVQIEDSNRKIGCWLLDLLTRLVCMAFISERGALWRTLPPVVNGLKRLEDTFFILFGGSLDQLGFRTQPDPR